MGKKRFIVILIILTNLSLLQGISGDTKIQYVKSNSTVDGSSFELFTTIDDSTSVRKGDVFSVRVGLWVISFGDSVRDFHDIIFGVNIENQDTTFQQSKTEVTTGSITREGYGYDKVFTFSIPTESPSWFNLYVTAEFREDIAWATDPGTSTPWEYIENIKVGPAITPILTYVGVALILLGIVMYIRKQQPRKSSHLQEQSLKQMKEEQQSGLATKQTTTYPEQPQFCSTCGTKLIENSIYCNACGDAVTRTGL